MVNPNFNGTTVLAAFNTTQAEIAAALLAYPTAQLASALLFIFSITSVCFNTLLMRGLFRCAIIQPNCKVLLVNISIAAMIRAIASLVEVSINTARLYQIVQLPSLKVNCLWEHLPNVLASYSLSLSMVGVAWERAIATKHFSSYERHPQFPTKTYVVASWMVPAILTIAGRFGTNGAYFYPACKMALIYEGSLLIGFCAVNTFIGVVSLTIFLAVHCANIKRLRSYLYNRAQLSLSARFQLSNNLEMTRTLMPSIVLHVATYLCADLTYIYVAYVGERNFRSAVDIMIVLAYMGVLVMGFAAVHPICILLISPKLRSRSLWPLNFPRRIYAVGPLQVGRRKSLEPQWQRHARTAIPLVTLAVNKSFAEQLESSQHNNSAFTADQTTIC